jgi:GDP-4-dehydro-6-deoxy-D-mannose reductase
VFKRLLITGANGFVGGWVLRHCRLVYPETIIWASGYGPEPEDKLWNQYRQIDLRDPCAANHLIDEARPDGVLHLAGITGSAPLDACININVLGTENLFRGLQKAGLVKSTKVVQISSAATYGLVRAEELPIREDQVLRPVSPYAVSKLAQDYLAQAWHRREGLRVCVGRAFNLLGPGQPPSLVPMTFLKQILSARDEKADRIRVGNLTPRRDFVDIRDVATALTMLLEKGATGCIYNIGSGCDISIKKVLDILVGFHGSPIKIEQEMGRERAVDVPEVRADASRIKTDLGWQPKYSLEESLKWLWDLSTETGEVNSK